jgi:hypothetical protein
VPGGAKWLGASVKMIWQRPGIPVWCADSRKEMRDTAQFSGLVFGAPVRYFIERLEGVMVVAECRLVGIGDA